MFVYGADFFLFWPGVALTIFGAALTLPLSFGPLTIGPITMSLHWMLLGLSTAILGLQCVYMGILAKVFFDYSGEITKRWFAIFPYTRTVGAAAGMFFLGLGLMGALLAFYLRHHFVLEEGLAVNHLGVTGIFFMIAGFMTFTFTLLLHATAVAVWRRP
jgi:hypothetical protein